MSYWNTSLALRSRIWMISSIQFPKMNMDCFKVIISQPSDFQERDYDLSAGCLNSNLDKLLSSIAKKISKKYQK